MYAQIDILTGKSKEVIVQIKPHEAQLQREVNEEVAAMFSKLQTKSEKQSEISMCVKFHSSECDGSSLESENHRCKHTQELYRCHMIWHIARYSPSMAQVESPAATEAAEATEKKTISIEVIFDTTTPRDVQSTESWYSDSVITSVNCSDRQRLEW